jgi:G3E family GTPase
MVLRWLPVTHNKAVDAEAAASALGDSPIKSVLRSKGFMWISNKHTTAFYWSHAGGSVVVPGVVCGGGDDLLPGG